MRVALQAWYDEWLEEHRAGTDLIYAGPKDPSLAQVHFVRDKLGPLLWCDKSYEEVPTEPPPRTDCRETAWVIGEHRSKSVRLPVYLLERPDLGIQFVLRDNFHDWKLSVISERPIDDPLFEYLFHTAPEPDPDYTGRSLSSVYFEGFPDDLVFGFQKQDQRRWSASVSQSALRTVVLLTMKQLGALRPLRHLTREEFRAELDRDSALSRARRDARKAGEKTWR